MRSIYTDYVRLYLLMGYSRDDSEFYARKETDDLSETPDNNADKEIPTKKSQKKKTPTNEDNADKEVPEKEEATIPKPEALD